MILSPQETERFYRIWWPLLNYVNTQQQIAPDFPATPEQGSINPQDAQQIRRVLWETEALREAFITENPAQLSAADLELVASWRYRIAGKFLIFRYLKNYTIFLAEQRRPPQAYGVLGLVSPIAEVVPWPPPVMVDAVLLPPNRRFHRRGLDQFVAPIRNLAARFLQSPNFRNFQYRIQDST